MLSGGIGRQLGYLFSLGSLLVCLLLQLGVGRLHAAHALSDLGNTVLILGDVGGGDTGGSVEGLLQCSQLVSLQLQRIDSLKHLRQLLLQVGERRGDTLVRSLHIADEGGQGISSLGELLPGLGQLLGLLLLLLVFLLLSIGSLDGGIEG